MVLTALVLACGSSSRAQEPLDLGSRLEPFVDRYVIDSMTGTELRLHHPIPGEAVIAFDKPWEGKFCGYTTVLKDRHLYYMYYRGLPIAAPDGSDNETTCIALSIDGIHWTKPDLGLFEVHGAWANNVIIANAAPLSHNFSPLVDTKPDIPDDARFKGLSGTRESGLIAWASPDGILWRKLRPEPVMTEGYFDSQNLAFWSEHEQCYIAYFRIFTKDGFRSVSRCTSPDFMNWTEPVEMTFGDTPREHLYTNHTLPYFRAPHIYTSIAARFMPGRRVISQEKMAAMGGDASYSGDCSDAVFFTTRGGNVYDRTFMEGFVRPGIGFENWTSRTNYPAYGIIPVGESQMSFYINRNYGQDSAYLQRMILRLDGFASVHAPYAGGEMVTKPLRFTGSSLAINYATSAAGSIWVELCDAEGTPIPGFTQADADEVIGDEIARVMTWKGNADLGSLSGQAVRLRFVMKDADLYSIHFE